MSVVGLSVDAIGDVFGSNTECIIVGTQGKCGYLLRNNNQEYTDKCWHCSTTAQVVIDAFADQQLIFNLISETGVHVFFLKKQCRSSIVVRLAGLCNNFTFLFDFEMLEFLLK